MRDNLKQVGNYIKRAGKDADLAIKRTYVKEPSIERIRDIFDPITPFKASFMKSPKADKVSLDINFGKRLPNITCCADCICGATESFSSDDLISSQLTLANPYVTNSTIVYLNGTPAVRNTDYVESNPEGGVITILSSASVITVSYVYTTEGCSENDCVDVFPCPPFVSLSGLSVVFADRFDRPSGPYPAGGCGAWYSNISTLTLASITTGGGEAVIDITKQAGLGGAAQLCGRTFEISVAAFSPVGTGVKIISGNGALFTVSVSMSHNASLGLINYTLSVPWNIVTGICAFGNCSYTTNEEVVQKVLATTYTPNTPMFYSLAQLTNNDVVFKVWAQDEDVSNAETLTITLADVVASTTYTDLVANNDIALEPHLVGPTIRAVTAMSDRMQAIRVGTGLDTGIWGPLTYGGAAYDLAICRQDPAPDEPLYFNPCDVETITSTSTTATNVYYNAFVANEIHVGGPNPPGAIVSNIEQRVAAIAVNIGGNPMGIRVKGEIALSFVDPGHTLSVTFRSFFGQGSPSYNNSAYTGTIIASMPLTTGADFVPFDILIPTDGITARWSVQIEGIDNFAHNLPYLGDAAPFLTAPSFWISTVFRGVEYYGLQSADCSGDDCGDCTEDRCPDVIDGFYDSYAAFSTPSSITFDRLSQSGTRVAIEQDDGTTMTALGGGIGQVSFSLETSGFSGFYNNYDSAFDCHVTGNFNIYQADFDFMVSSLSPGGGNYAEIGFSSQNGGPFTYIDLQSGVATLNVNNLDYSVSLSANTWTHVTYRAEGPDLILTIGGQTYEYTGIFETWGYVNTFGIWAGYQFTASTPTWTAQFKNVAIRRIDI